MTIPMTILFIIVTFIRCYHLSLRIPPGTCQKRKKNRIRGGTDRGKGRQGRIKRRGGVIEKERGSERRRRPPCTKRSLAPYFLTLTLASNRKHVRYLTETRWRRAYIIGPAYTDDIDSLRSMKHAVGDDWGRLRSQGVRVCACSTSAVCARVLRLYLRASLPVRSTVRPSVHPFIRPSVRPSVCRPTDRSVGSPRVSVKKRKSTGKRDVRADSGSFVIRSHGRTRDWGSRSYLQDGRNFMSYNGQRARARHGP